MSSLLRLFCALTAAVTLGIALSTAREARAATFTVNATAVNEAPVANPQSVTTDEDVSRTITLTGSDAEGGPLTFTVVSGPSHGTLSGSGASRVYTPHANYNGPDGFTFKVNDGQADSAEAAVSITVNAINDPPVNSVPGPQTTSQNVPLVFSAANSNAITVSDVDAGSDPLRVTLTTVNGTLTLGSTAGLTFVSGDGADDTTMTFTGSQVSINAGLNGLTFKPVPNGSGLASFQIITLDQGFNGGSGARSDIDSFTIFITPGGEVRFAGPGFNASEVSGTLNVTVTRSGGSGGTATVNYATTGGTATGGASCAAGVDFVNTSGTLSWANGESGPKTIAVTLCNDPLDEPDETAGLTLSGIAGSATLTPQPTTTLTILDDDLPAGVFEFHQPTYTAGEGAGRLTVTVRRTGVTAQAATVDYSTNDGSTAGGAPVPCSSTGGSALDRCDFTKTIGRLRFAAGETAKTFDVLLTDDSYFEGTETASFVLSNPGGGAVLGPQSTATLQITDDAPETSGNPIDADEKFVRQQYHDFFSREPDAAGLGFWTNNISSCGADQACREAKRIDTSAAFFLSIEFQETGFLVYRMYQAAYGNLPGKPVPLTLTDFLPDTQQIGQGVVVNAPGWEQALEQNKQAFANEFVARPRFNSVFPVGQTPEQYVEALNQNTGGTLSPAERATLAGELRSGTKTRAEVLRAVAEDADLARAESNRAFVLMQYFGYLRRNPNDAPELNLDFSGYDFWLGKLNGFGGDFRRAEMVKSFLVSGEYRSRFGQP